MNLARSVTLTALGLGLVVPACTTAPAPEDVAQHAELAARPVHVAAMGPLVIGRLDAPHDPSREAEWSAFAADIAQAKTLGVESVSIDVWWGSVEREGDDLFDFAWVDRVAAMITDAGLRWRPVLAFHACGTNVGDTCHVPLPPWVFDEYVGRHTPETGTIVSAADLRYVSAQGNTSDEVLSVWSTPLVLEQYRRFFEVFATRYAHLAPQTSGVAIGLGPASELRYPSYNTHDAGSGYPGPGVVQAYSRLAKRSFRRWALSKYGGAAGVASAWGLPIASEADVRVPEPAELAGMFERGEHVTTERGRDLFDWYRDSLLEHGRMVLGAAADVFQASAFHGVRLSARVPGVHWRAADSRRAELAAGLLATREAADWSSDDAGHGYDPLVRMLAELRARPDRPNVALEYTCLEKGNGEGGPAVGSMAEALVFWVASAAHRRGVPIGGENALAGGLWTDHGWARIRNALAWSHYDELTLLRLHDVVTSPVARHHLAELAP